MNVCVCSGGRSRDVRCRFSQGLDALGGEMNCPKACFIVKSLYDDHWQEHRHRRMGFDILIPDLDVGRCDQSIARRRPAERSHHQLSNFKLTRYVQLLVSREVAAALRHQRVWREKEQARLPHQQNGDKTRSTSLIVITEDHHQPVRDYFGRLSGF